MAHHIHVVLTEDLANVGKSGELVRVRPGFARNYLVPRGLAISATAENVTRIEHEKKVVEAKNAKLKGEAEDVYYVTVKDENGRMVQRKVDKAFLDLTDIQNRDFRYIL